MANVVMVAYSCNPEGFSEELVGWNLATRLAERHNILLLTRPNDREIIERHLPSRHPLEIEYHELDRLYRLKRFGIGLMNTRYLIWNHVVNRRVRQLVAERSADLVHQTTWARQWMPSAAAGSGRPFVWGPVGAVERTPASLMPTLSRRTRLQEHGRHFGSRIVSFDSLHQATMDSVAVAVATSREAAKVLSATGARVEVAPSVAVDPDLAGEITPAAMGFDFLSVGRMLGWKGFHLGLRALARTGDADTTYGVIGDGPELGRLQAVARDLRIAHRVTFLGRLDKRETLRVMAASRVLVHPSFHDSGGFVLAEGMAFGLPVVCLDVGGPPVIVGPDAGIAVPVGHPDAVVAGLAAAMERCAGSEHRAYAAAARQRVRTRLTWDHMVDLYDDIYRSVPISSF